VFFGAPHKESTDSPWEDLVFDIALASTELRRESRRDILTAIIKAGAGGVRDTSERFNQLVGQYRTLNFFACKSSSTTGSVVCTPTQTYFVPPGNTSLKSILM